MAEHGANIDTNPKHDMPAEEMLSDWIQCICVVTFDLEFGQAMEVLLWQSCSVHARLLPGYLVMLFHIFVVFFSFTVGLPQQHQIVRGRQNKPLLPCFPRLQFWLHGRHSVSRQDKVCSTFESQSTPYKLQCKMSSFLTSWSSFFVWICFFSTNQRSVSSTGLFSKSMFNCLFLYNTLTILLKIKYIV